MANAASNATAATTNPGDWEDTKLEATSTTSTWGMMYRSTAGLNTRTKQLADELHKMISDTNVEVDNPLVLSKITALSGNYNMARQLQSNVMKSIKDAAQAIIRNV